MLVSTWFVYWSGNPLHTHSVNYLQYNWLVKFFVFAPALHDLEKTP